MVIYHKTPNWVVPRPNDPWPAEKLKEWNDNPWVYKMWRANKAVDDNYFILKVIQNPKGPEAAQYRAMATAHLEATVTDERLRKILLPDYAPFARRFLVSNDFYPTVMMPHVHLVQETIEEITEKGIKSNANDPIRKETHAAEPEKFDREFDIIVGHHRSFGPLQPK
jgi:cation diffusion facilitator CzcD-associated flavoprotein CzcO